MSRHAVAIVLLVLLPASVPGEEPFRYPEATHGKGELKYRNGLPLLVVAGTPEEMGEQIGVLALKPVNQKVSGLVKGAVQQQVGPAWPVVVKVCEKLFEQFPADYRKEIESLAKAGQVDRDILVVANTIGDVQHIGGCSTFIVESSRSTTGHPLFGRNWDIPPVGDLAKYGLVIIRRPTGKRSFASITFPGLLFCGSEMNDAGLALATNDVREAKDGSPRLEPSGTPLAVAGRRLMEECADLQQADKLLTGLKATTCGNLILCDTKAGVVYEFTPKNKIARRAEDGICLCTNHFRTKELAGSTKCSRYEKLENCSQKPKLGIDDVARALHEVHQGELTMQSMVFEPAALRIHLAIGPGPVTKQPLKLIDCASLFKVEPK
jgi:isopenicillin-N N-acyltransferase-like protein